MDPKRSMTSQAKGGLPPKRPKSSCLPDSSSPTIGNDHSSTQSSKPSQVDSIGESPSTQPQTSGLTEEEARKLLEGLIKRSRSPVWAHYERYIHYSGSSYSIRAKCVYCLKADYACDTSANGTKSLNNHIEKCKEYPPNKIKVDAKQKVLSFDNPTKVLWRCIEKAKIDSKGLVFMDVPTRWNSTYLMLQSALKFRGAFDRLKDDDSGYEYYFVSDKMIGPPSDVDWENANLFASFLKPFYDITLRVCCSNTPTIHQAFMDVLKIFGLLNETNGIRELDSIRNSMLAKYQKYWGELKKINQYFFLAVVLDPRHKLDKVEDFFEVLCRGSSENIIEDHVNGVKDLLRKLCDIYGANVIQPTQSEASNPCISSGNETSNTSSEVEKLLLERSLLRKAKKSVIIQNDMDRYLLDAIEGDEDENFDILNWWRVNGASKYPTLGIIARDILAIPVSTIASESCFSTSGRIIDSFRSSLSPKMVEALICTQNWLRGSDVALNHEPTTEEMELCEMIEKEMSNNVVFPSKGRSSNG